MVHVGVRDRSYILMVHVRVRNLADVKMMVHARVRDLSDVILVVNVRPMDLLDQRRAITFFK